MPRLELDEVSLHYDQFGEGPDVVWLSGGGSRGSAWHTWYVPFLAGEFRSTTLDNRGVGDTVVQAPLPWTIADMADDAARLIETACEPPVLLFGHSMGALIVLQLALDRPDLVRCGIASGGGACGSAGWLGAYMGAEVELRRRGTRLGGMFALTHTASQLYPARALGDSGTWERLEEGLVQRGYIEDNEDSLIGQWQACIDFDITDRAHEIAVPIHVFAYEEDVQAPPQFGEELARLVPGAELHLFDGLGHGSYSSHAHEVVKPVVRDVFRRYV